MNEVQKNFKRKLVGFGMLSVFFVFVAFGFGAVKAFGQDHFTTSDAASTNGNIVQKNTNPEVVKYAYLAAAVAVGLGAIGGGLAVGYVGAAAMGAIAEKPELAVRALLFVGLAEGIAIYGLIISIMILQKV